jgi:hypothetical protein
MLVGFTVCRGTVWSHDVVKAIQPIYLTPEGRKDGRWRGRPIAEEGRSVQEPFRVEAHRGYAVGGIVARGSQRVNGFKVIFMRVRGDELDPADAYESQWLGGDGGGRELRLGNGRPVVGVYGKAGADLDCLGLMQLQP